MKLGEYLDKLEHLQAVDDFDLKMSEALAKRCGLMSPDAFVITVTGTNGKGSTVAILEAILLASGLSVGTFTSPHLLSFNERIRINGQNVSDQVLISAFEFLSPLTAESYLGYFKHSFFAALYVFQQQFLDVILLEVGIGGRLDVTNIIDSDLAVITSIGLDHMDRLGNTREQIAHEKAGIMRQGRAVIIGDPNPPKILFDIANKLSSHSYALNKDYGYQDCDTYWQWSTKNCQKPDLPKLNLGLDNASTALMALNESPFTISDQAIIAGLKNTFLPGRFEQIKRQGQPDIILDVAHNKASAQRLADSLNLNRCQGETYGLFSAMSDKDIEGIVMPMVSSIRHWFYAQLKSSRGASLDQLSDCLPGRAKPFDNLAMAWRSIMSLAQSNDRIVVFGSFHLVAAVKKFL